ncbi:MAG: hypothetical protein HY690_02585 [Chloroflexi bacterium]|nr:hypothetical protein [Chloroflexota bacterium]
MVELFAVLLAAVALGMVALVLAPLRRPPTPGLEAADPAADLLAAREAALQALRELDFDYRLGNLAETDYRALRERHKLQAIALLKATNGRSEGEADALDAEIERAVRAPHPGIAGPAYPPSLGSGPRPGIRAAVRPRGARSGPGGRRRLDAARPAGNHSRGWRTHGRAGARDVAGRPGRP